MLDRLWSGLFYFSSMDDFAYLFGIIAFLLAVIQFGLPFAEPLILRRFKNRSRIEVLSMINRILGVSAYISLWLIPFFIAVFIVKFINTTLLYFGVVVLNSYEIYLISAFVAGIVIYLIWRLIIKKYILDPSYVVPKSSNEKLEQQTNRLINTVEQLIVVMKAREEQTNKLIRMLEAKEKNIHSQKQRHN
jgi:hypothetical protein